MNTFLVIRNAIKKMKLACTEVNKNDTIYYCGGLFHYFIFDNILSTATQLPKSFKVYLTGEHTSG